MAFSQEQFQAELLAQGDKYHIHHPYQRMLNEGQLTKHQVQMWVANRFYYQIMIPRKDAAILANCPDQQLRKIWVQRILDHDGRGEEPGGIEAWLLLADAVGLAREEVVSLQHVLPGVKFAVDAYWQFAHSSPWQDAVCSSLTELFAPRIHKMRLDTWPAHYPWINESGLLYFKKRITQARKDVECGLEVTLAHFTTTEQQQHALKILQFKLDVLWCMLDAMYVAYIAKVPRPGEEHSL